jgi:hypothetical protein
MNKKTIIGIGIFVILVTLLLTFGLTKTVNAQSIITNNSNTALNSITYQLDIAELNLSNINNMQFDSNTNTTTITNISNIINYECSLGINNYTYLNGGSTTTLNALINIMQSLNITLTDNYYALALNCTYNITSFNTTTYIVLYYNETSNDTYNITNISSYNVSSQTFIPTIKNILVDTSNPMILLYAPINSSIYTNNSNTTVTLNFTISDLSQTNCTLSLNNNTDNLQSNITSIQYILPLGNYTYNLSCIDALNNSNLNSSNFKVLSNVTPVEDVFLNIQLTKPSFGLGEIGQYIINANNNSNVTITICPVASGWVQCYVTPVFVNYTYPLTQALPYTNKTGKYMIQAVMNYKNYTLSTNTTYDTANTITATITASNITVGVGSIITFNAVASGGIGTYSYKWTMHDNTRFDGTSAYKNYTSSGTYKVNLNVNDSQGNQYNTSIDVVIKNYYTLTVVVTDKDTGSRITDSKVEVNNDIRQTDSNGIATFRLLDNSYDIYVSKNNYGGYVNSVGLSADRTVYMNMSFQDVVPPRITLLTDNDFVFSQDNVKLKFKADDATNVACSLYTASMNDSWYTLKDSGDNLLANTEYTFELTNLSYGGYKWRVECFDTEKNKGVSEERKFVISDSNTALVLQYTNSNSDAINTALDNLNKLSGEESEVADILTVREDLKDLLERINRMDKDIHDLAFRRDLDEKGKQDVQQNLTQTLEYMKYNTPINIQISDSKTFVKYIKDIDLNILLEEYISIKNMNVNKKAFLESTKSVQSKAVISTRVRSVVLHYLDGKTKEITLVTKTIKPSTSDDELLFENSKTITFVEVVPKSIASSMKQLNMLNKEYTVLKDDPVIEFAPNIKTINYYIDKKVDAQDFQKVDTVIIDKNINALRSPTGLAILGVDNISDIPIDGQTIMIVLILVLLMFYLVLHFELIDKLRSIGFGSKKKITYVKVLINDALDYLEAEDYEKAAFVYREIKLSYESSNSFVRKKVYTESYELCNKLDLKYTEYLLEHIESYIRQENKTAAILEFDKLEKTYNRLDDSYKARISDKFKNALEKIKTVL